MSSSTTGQWTLCLTQQQRRTVVHVNPNKDTIKDLYELACKSFESSIESLSCGFPPKPLAKNDTTTIMESCISNQERILVTISASTTTRKNNNKKNATKVLTSKKRAAAATASSSSAAATKKSTNATSRKRNKITTISNSSSINSDKINNGDDDDDDYNNEEDGDNNSHSDDDTKNNTNNDNNKRRTKRAAAQAATESFGVIIEEQDRIMKLENQKKKQKEKRKAPSPKKQSPIIKKQSPPPKSIGGTGRRLNDGAVMKSSASNSKSKSIFTGIGASSSNKNKNKTTNSGEDMSVQLLGALNDRGTMGRILRKGLSNAVQNSYETNRAVTRIAAILAHTNDNNKSNSEDKSTNKHLIITKQSNDDNKLIIKYMKGVQGRGYYEEIVDYIPIDILKQVVSSIYKTNIEALRPQNIAFLSPRVLWSLVYEFCYKNNEDENNSAGSSKCYNIEQAMEKLLPELDWNFFNRRKQKLSAKAIENLRQQQEEKEGGAEENWHYAAEAIQDVEHAMENLQSFDKSTKINRMAQAALKRQQQPLNKQEKNEESSWKIMTPNETDEEELLECINHAPLTTNSNSDASTKLNNNRIVNGLIELNIHNWRELANIDDSTKLLNDLIHKINEQEKKEKNMTPPPSITLNHIEQWIDYAQEQSLDEIMIEICDNNIRIVELLREYARSGTPKDLAMWKNIPEHLYNQLVSIKKNNSGSTESKSSNKDDDDDHDLKDEELPQLETIRKWCNRAAQLLQSADSSSSKEFEWVHWYATPIV